MIKLRPHDLKPKYFKLLHEVENVDVVELCVEQIHKIPHNEMSYIIEGYLQENNGGHHPDNFRWAFLFFRLEKKLARLD